MSSGFSLSRPPRRFPALRILLGLLVALGTATMTSSASFAAPATVPVTASSVKACVQSFEAGTPHLLSLNEARACAPGASESNAGQRFRLGSGSSIMRTPNGGARIIVGSVTAGTRDPTRLAAGPSMAASRCYNDWRSGTWYYDDGLIYGSSWATGYGNHCGYANFPSGPSTGWWCAACTSVSNPSGRWDNNYGRAYWNQNYATAWSNVYVYFGVFGSDTFFLRFLIDPNANFWLADW